MAGFIEDFYYGNHEAQSYSKEFANDLKKKLNELTLLEKQLSEKLTDAEKVLFLSYADRYLEFTSLSVTDSFISGFRFGARFSIDTFTGE